AGCEPANVAERLWTSKPGKLGLQEKEKRNEEQNAGEIPQRNDTRADEALGDEKCHGGAQGVENYGQHWLGRSQPEREIAGYCGAGTGPNHRPEADYHSRQKVDCQFQDSQRNADRLCGYFARRQDVRISRPLVQRSSAARPRFPWTASERVRWPRQLHAGIERPIGISRN